MVCLVVDECHRATANHSVVQLVGRLKKARTRFRLLGLSATPGADYDAVKACMFARLCVLFFVAWLCCNPVSALLFGWDVLNCYVGKQ